MLRMELSPLRAHKHKYNFNDTSDPLCIVCGVNEDTCHYLLHCKSYRLARVSLLQEVSRISAVDISTIPQRRRVSILLYGSQDLTEKKPLNILNLVTSFIQKTKRLDSI